MKASQQFFEFDLLSSSIFTSHSSEKEVVKMKRELSNMYWVYWKSKSVMNSWYKTKIQQADVVSIEGLKEAGMIDRIASDLCQEGKV